MTKNLLLNTDSYKASMFLQYPENTEQVYSYIESRGGKYDETVFFGPQAYIKEYLMEPMTKENIEEATEVWAAHGVPFNKEGAEHILNKFGGYAPVEIYSVPEGTVVPTHNIMLSVENVGGKETAWFTTWLETSLLRAVWYGTTVATNSWQIKQTIKRALDKTGDPAGLPFKLHDFGARGASSYESSMLGGMAHLVNFMGTDTIAATIGARRFYNENMAGFSIPAAEHSTITSWGKENEVQAYRNMLKQFAKPGSLVAVVSDSYDIYNAVENLWGGELKQTIIDSGATVVIRPDSGDPVEVVTKIAHLLAQKFGYDLNYKGYKVLKNVRIIQGDGINAQSISDILKSLISHGFSADNIAFGMGGALLQAPQRDDQKFAMKCSAISVNGIWRDVFKDPITDAGKRSKKGKLALIKEAKHSFRSYSTIRLEDLNGRENHLHKIYEPGKLLVDDTLSAIRERSNDF